MLAKDLLAKDTNAEMKQVPSNIPRNQPNLTQYADAYYILDRPIKQEAVSVAKAAIQHFKMLQLSEISLKKREAADWLVSRPLCLSPLLLLLLLLPLQLLVCMILRH